MIPFTISMDTLECIKRFIEMSDGEKFLVHSKVFAERLQSGIKKSYEKREPDIVSIIKNIVNSVNVLETNDRHFKILTSSVFIHGNKSQVEFEYYGKKTKRELGDIIFILSIVYKGEKYFEKMTINQVKKSNNVSWTFYTDSSKEQLYLLSKFPTFKGVNALLIPGKEYNLLNFSGCLGTYGLLYPPGEFALISSKLLAILTTIKRSIRLKDLFINTPSYNFQFAYFCCFKNYYRKSLFCYTYCPAFYCLPVYRNSYISYYTHDFSDKYLRGLIGELIYAKDLPFDNSAFQFLQDLMMAIQWKAKKEKNKEMIDFIASYRRNINGGDGGIDGLSEFNYEYGGMGIIYTVVDLGSE